MSGDHKQDYRKGIISLVVPTTGKEKNLFRCLDSIAFNAPADLLSKIELIVYVNPDPASPPNRERIDAYLRTLEPQFDSVRLFFGETFALTAEESAHAATAHATGALLWISGDKRLYLPEGLQRLHAWTQGAAPTCAYFNSIWLDSNAHTEGHASVHFNSPHAVMPHKRFVMMAGVNYISTSMGAWVLRTELMDRDVWQLVIETCGPHFSHVTTMMFTLGDQRIDCFSEYLFLLEAKAYHAGNDEEWYRYSQLAGTYRYYAWTFGLVRQFEFLINAGVYSYADFRRAMCSEGTLLKRQVDEVYQHLFAQLRYGWARQSQRITVDEFQEILRFLRRACPEREILNQKYQELFTISRGSQRRKFAELCRSVATALQQDYLNLRFATLLVAQFGGRYVRLHPRGYLVSDVTDDHEFLLAYKLFDAPTSSYAWEIVEEADLTRYLAGVKPDIPDNLFADKNARWKPECSLRHRLTQWLASLGPVIWVYCNLSNKMQNRLKRLFY